MLRLFKQTFNTVDVESLSNLNDVDDDDDEELNQPEAQIPIFENLDYLNLDQVDSMLNKEIVEISTLSFPSQRDNNQILIDENDIQVYIENEIQVYIENDEYIMENNM